MSSDRPWPLVVALLGAAWAPLPQEAEDPAERVHGGAAAFSLVDEERESIWLPAGSPVFEAPDAGSIRLDTIDALCEIEVLEETDGWYRVHHEGRNGWVKPDLPVHERGLDAFPSPEPVEVETPGLWAATTPDERFEVALEALGLPAPNGRLGPWRLMTDVADQGLLERLDRIAVRLPSSYLERFGVEPTPPEEQAVAIFATEEAYRPFESEVTHLSTLGARGHAGDRLAALFIEGDRLEAAATLLVHELTHLMNRSVLGSDPPQWIEEGIASELAYCRITRSGEILLGSLNGERVVSGSRRTGLSISYSGAVAALADVSRKRARRKGTPLEELVSLDRDSFLARDRQLHYAESAFLVRFLLEAARGRYAEGFRAYLASLASERPDGPGELITRLDTTWPRLERDFDAWLRMELAQALR